MCNSHAIAILNRTQGIVAKPIVSLNPFRGLTLQMFVIRPMISKGTP